VMKIECYSVKDVASRLSKIEGHVRAIKRMTEENKPCEDILLQVGAVKAALDKVGRIILEGHIEGCVMDGIKEGKGEEVVRQLKNALAKYI